MKSAPEIGPLPAELPPSDIRDTLRRGELIFPPEEDTQTAHGTRTLAERPSEIGDSDAPPVDSEARIVAASAGRPSLPSSSTPTVPRPSPSSASMPRSSPSSPSSAPGAPGPHAPPFRLRPSGTSVAAQSVVPRQRNTIPIPPPLAGTPITGIPLARTGDETSPPIAPAGLPLDVLSGIVDLDDEDIGVEMLPSEALEEELTATKQRAFTPPAEAFDDPPTSPTLSLAERSEASRDVYRLFLASEYAPALDLASELMAQGDDDPMLVTIARECRASLDNQASNSAPASPFRGLTFDGNMTLAAVAELTNLSTEQIIGLLERFVVMGVLTVRSPLC